MKAWKLERILYKAARTVGDIQAIRTGHYIRRRVRRSATRSIFQLLRKVTRGVLR